MAALPRSMYKLDSSRVIAERPVTNVRNDAMGPRPFVNLVGKFLFTV